MFDGIYHSMMTATTIGLGEYGPVTQGGRCDAVRPICPTNVALASPLFVLGSQHPSRGTFEWVCVSVTPGLSCFRSAFAIFHILCSVLFFAYFFGLLVEMHSDLTLRRRKEKLRTLKLDMDLILSLDTDGNGVDRFEFVVGMIVKLGIISQEDVQPFVDEFDKVSRISARHGPRW